MVIFDYNRMVPYSSEQMFDLIWDVERYPEFLPGWRHTRLLEREGNRFGVDQELGWGGFRIHFSSQVIYTRPERVDVTSTEGPFRRLNIRWFFEPADQMCCVIHLHIDSELRATVFRHMMKTIIKSRLCGVVSAFEERAYRVYSGINKRSESSHLPDAASFH